MLTLLHATIRLFGVILSSMRCSYSMLVVYYVIIYALRIIYNMLEYTPTNSQNRAYV
jgi:hypothetical protein